MKIPGIAVRKSRGETTFLIMACVSAILSVTVIASAPLYFDSIERLGLRRTLDRFERSQMGAWLHVNDMTFNASAVRSTESNLQEIGTALSETVRENAIFTRSGILNLAKIDDRFAPPGSVLVFQSIKGPTPPISLVSGRFPSNHDADQNLEIAILESVAAEYRITVGDELRLAVPPTNIIHSSPVVTGTFQIDDGDHEFWLGLSSTLFDPKQGPTGGRPAIIAYTSESMMDRVANRGIADVGQIWAMFYSDQDKLRGVGVGEYLEAVDRFRTEAARILPSSSSFAGLDSALRTLKRQLTFTNTVTIIGGALFAAFALFVLVLNTSVISRRWVSEEIAFKVRGANRQQLLLAVGFYVLLLFVLPAIVGPLLSSIIVPSLGYMGAFRDLTGGEPFPFRILPEQFLWSTIAMSILLVIFAAPSLLAKSDLISNGLTRLREGHSPWIWRANLDFGIVIAAAAVIFELNGRGSLFVRGDNGLTDLSFLAASLPVVAAVAASLVALRLFRVTGMVFERLARVDIHPMMSLALKVFSRSTMRHAVLMLLAAGTIIVVINANGLSSTLGRNTLDRIDFETVADMRISGIDGYKASDNPVVNEITELDWVDSHAWATRTEARTGGAESSTAFEMFSVKPEQFANIASFRSDFADETLPELMNRIAEFAPTGSLKLPNDTVALTATISLQRIGKGRIDVWSRLIDADGTTHTVRLTAVDGSQSGDSWHEVSGSIRDGLPRPLRLLAIEIYEPPTSPIGSAATLTVDSLYAVDATGIRKLVSEFTNVGQWHLISTSIDGDSEVSVTSDSSADSSDSKSLRIAMGRGTDDGVRGVYVAQDGATVVPLLVNPALLAEAVLSVGDRFTGKAYGRFIPFEIRGVARLFPSITDGKGAFGIANVDAVLSYLTPVSEPFLSNSAELVLDVDESIDFRERIAAIKAIEPSLRVSDRTALLSASSTRLGDAAGWRVVGGLISVSAVVIAVITMLAVVMHNQDMSRLEFALLESMGVSRLGIVVEAATRILLAVCIGYVLGLIGGYYGVSFAADRMTRSSTGETALPPMLLEIEWALVAGTAILLALVAVAPVIWNGIKPSDTVATRIRASSTS